MYVLIHSQQDLSACWWIYLGVEAPADAAKALPDGAPSGQSEEKTGKCL